MPLRLKPGPGRHGALRLVRSFARSGDGATAVEFALISIPFLGLLCAIIETAMVFWAGQILDTSLGNATRGIYTGSFQGKNPSSSGNTQILTNLRNLMCYPNGDTGQAALTTIFDCKSVKIDVLTFQQFAGSAASNPVDATTSDWAKDFGTRYTTPAPGDIVIVQAAVKFPVFSSVLNPAQASFKDGSRLLRSTVAFRTEPYQ